MQHITYVALLLISAFCQEFAVVFSRAIVSGFFPGICAPVLFWLWTLDWFHSVWVYVHSAQKTLTFQNTITKTHTYLYIYLNMGADKTICSSNMPNWARPLSVVRVWAFEVWCHDGVICEVSFVYVALCLLCGGVSSSGPEAIWVPFKRLVEANSRAVAWCACKRFLVCSLQCVVLLSRCLLRFQCLLVGLVSMSASQLLASYKHERPAWAPAMI